MLTRDVSAAIESLREQIGGRTTIIAVRHDEIASVRVLDLLSDLDVIEAMARVAIALARTP